MSSTVHDTQSGSVQPTKANEFSTGSSAHGSGSNSNNEDPLPVPDVERKASNNSSGFAPLFRSLTAGGHTVDTSQPAFPVYHRKIGNPTPLGLMGFATTTWVLGLYECGARGVSAPETIVALCVATGGLAQFVAGVWEFAVGNTFGATAFVRFQPCLSFFRLYRVTTDCSTH